MRYVAAYLLSVLGGNDSPNTDDIKKILGSVAVDVDEQRLMLVIRQLSGQNINQLMEKGMERLYVLTSHTQETQNEESHSDDQKNTSGDEPVNDDSDFEDDDENVIGSLFG